MKLPHFIQSERIYRQVQNSPYCDVSKYGLRKKSRHISAGYIPPRVKKTFGEKVKIFFDNIKRQSELNKEINKRWKAEEKFWNNYRPRR